MQSAQKCRPDWDITTPEMKAAWKEGRKELFYPYGKTYAQTLVLLCYKLGTFCFDFPGVGDR